LKAVTPSAYALDARAPQGRARKRLSYNCYNQGFNIQAPTESAQP
jgi:hypothetical protein